MLLTSLKFEHYRGIKALELSMGPTTVLVGENNCGKRPSSEGLASSAIISGSMYREPLSEGTRTTPRSRKSRDSVA